MPDTLHAATNQLPSFHTVLVGREEDIEALLLLLEQPVTRLITLTGPGGVGKTRLAVEAAAAAEALFPDGITWIPLANVTEAELVLPSIAIALGIQTSADRDESTVRVIAGFVGESRMLLLLDNVEQVIGVGTDLVRLLSICPNLTIMVTSRAALRVSGEIERPVQPLQVEARRSIPPAVALFVERAQAVRPDFELSPLNQAAITEICDRLDGLPLAIELAAARTKILSPQALLTRLSHSLQVLTSGPRDAPARLQTMRDAIRWSFDLLSDDERRLFQRLGVFAGGFSLDAVEAICDDAELPAIDVLMGLIDQSLVVREESGDEFRFSLLGTIREYALEELNRSDEGAEIHQRHARYFREFAQSVSVGFMTSAETELMNRVEIEIANLRSAFDTLLQLDPDSAAHMAADLWYFFGLRGRYREGLSWLQHVTGPDPAIQEPARGRAELATAYLHWVLGEYEVADRWFRAAGERFAAIGDEFRIAISNHGLGLSLRDQGHRDAESLEHLRLALATFRDGHPAWTTFTLSAIGAIYRGQQDWENAIEVLEEGRSAAIQAGFTGGLIPILDHLGDMARERGRLEEAVRYYLEALPLWEEARDPHGAADSILGLAAVLAQLGRDFWPISVSLHAAAHAMYDRVGLPHDRLEQDPALTSLRAKLGEAQYEECWEDGSSWHLAEAARAALGLELHGAFSASRDAAPPSNPAAEQYGLTARELEILTHLASGKSNIEIGELLFISHRTVGTHVTNIFEKLGVNTRAAATALALRSGLLSDIPTTAVPERSSKYAN